MVALKKPSLLVIAELSHLAHLVDHWHLLTLDRSVHRKHSFMCHLAVLLHVVEMLRRILDDLAAISLVLLCQCGDAEVGHEAKTVAGITLQCDFCGLLKDFCVFLLDRLVYFLEIDGVTGETGGTQVSQRRLHEHILSPQSPRPFMVRISHIVDEHQGQVKNGKDQKQLGESLGRHQEKCWANSDLLGHFSGV